MKKTISLLLCALLVCSCASLSVTAQVETYTNVILMIGDGMGENHLQLAKQERGISLFMEEECDLHGGSKTRSFSSSVTDSAAGGTALACGVRTNNGCVGVYPYDTFGLFSVPRSLTEAAKLSGRAAGVITTDSNDGATPASFTAHTSARGNSKDICTQQVTSDFDLIWGASSDDFDESLAKENGFTVIRTKSEMDALEKGGRSFAQFNYGETWKTATSPDSDAPTLSQMTAKAISQLENDNGFFLMVEGAHIDKFSHRSNGSDSYDAKVAGAAEAVEEFDNAVETAVQFARADGHTLVVVTADHETGGITCIDGTYTYTKTSHTGTDVPLLVFGSDDLIKDGEHIENRQVARRIGAKMGLRADLFPVKDGGKISAFWDRVCAWFQKLLDRIPAKYITTITTK